MPKKILIVEDEYDIASTMELVLDMEGYEVRLCSNGKEGIEALSSEALPSLIITDIMMPLMDGYVFVETVRQNKKYNNIPIILASAGRLDETKLSRKSYTTFMRKPFDVDELLECVETSLNK